MNEKKKRWFEKYLHTVVTVVMGIVIVGAINFFKEKNTWINYIPGLVEKTDTILRVQKNQFHSIQKITKIQSEDHRADSLARLDNHEQHKVMFKSLTEIGEKVKIKYVFSFPWLVNQ